MEENEESVRESFSEEAINTWTFKMLSSLSSIYAAIYFFNVDEDSFDEVKAYKDFPFWKLEEKLKGSEVLRRFCASVVQEKYRELIEAFSDMTTLDERLKHEDSISAEFINSSDEWCRCRLILTDKDRNGHVKAILFTVQNINAEKLQIHDLENALNQASNLAYRDALTGVKNKACFNDFQKQYDTAIEQGNADFAVAFFDVNGLKFVNDNFGHGKGDKLLIDASVCICKAFKDCPVFRLGGDEFAVIINHFAEKKISNYILALDGAVDGVNQNYGKEYRVSIAWGCAGYDASKHKCCADVFKNADEEMYKHKKLIKTIPGNDWMIRN